MAASYRVRLPDGSEYGPVDLQTLRTWHAEGRVRGDAFVLPEGAPEWVPVPNVLAGTEPFTTTPPGAARPPGAAAEAAGPDPRRQATPADPSSLAEIQQLVDGHPNQPQAARTANARPPTAQPASARPATAHPATARPATARSASARPATAHPATAPADRTRVLVGAGLGLVAALVLVLLALRFLVVPAVERWRAAARVQGEALSERQFSDPALGLTLDAPEGWVLLRPDSSALVAPSARARLAQPAVGAFATLSVQSLPPGVLPLDDFLDRVAGERRALVSDYRELGRDDVTLGGRPGRQLSASWVEGGAERQARIVAARDAWAYVALMAWGPAAAGDELASALAALVDGLSLSGVLDQEVVGTAAGLAPEFPELTTGSLVLLVRDRASEGGSAESIAARAVQAQSRGLAALPPEEARELQEIYAQIYAPLEDEDRRRIAAWQAEAREGRGTNPAQVRRAREPLLAAFAELPEETLLRLQALNAKAIAAGYAQR